MRSALLHRRPRSGGAPARRRGAARGRGPERAATWLGEAVSDDPALAARARPPRDRERETRAALGGRARRRACARAARRRRRARWRRSCGSKPRWSALALRAPRTIARRREPVLRRARARRRPRRGARRPRRAAPRARRRRAARVRCCARVSRGRLSDADRAVQLSLLGEANEKLGDVAAALQHYREALGLDAGREPAHAGLARLLVREGRSEEAIGALTAWAALREPTARRARRGSCRLPSSSWRAPAAATPPSRSSARTPSRPGRRRRAPSAR